MKRLLLIYILCSAGMLRAQTNISSTSALAELVMTGNYNPLTFMPSVVRNHPDSISQGILAQVSADSLKSYIITLASFYNRNSGSDTASQVTGIGAARRWVYQKFQQFSAANENRLIPSYLQFDAPICNMNQHRDVFAVLPAINVSDKRIIIMEAHIDSRCESLCDSLCLAMGVEDNASGTALVLELARVMSRYAYNNPLVFLVTTGEEQGLVGAEAFADYVQAKNISVKAVQNNDVTGGIICGQTSSAPSCPGAGNIDSTGVRLFSSGGFNSKHKGYSRFIKLEYKEMLRPFVTVPMDIRIMSPEDRTGRSGDHVPFRQHGYTAMRLTSANEHGDANVSNVNYTDRQHSTRDTLGTDTNNDNVIDSFFVDFNYLARNTVINGNAAGMAAVGPKTPDFQLSAWVGNLIINVTQETQYLHYRVGVRTTTNDWDSVYTMTNTTLDTFPVPPASVYYVSIASVDTNGIESLFSNEYLINQVGISEQPVAQSPGYELLQNRPNPFDEATWIGVYVDQLPKHKTAEIQITDLQGKRVRSIPITLTKGHNEVLYEHGYGASGTYMYALVLDGIPVMSKAMVFAN